jgi:hypothetical protein
MELLLAFVLGVVMLSAWELHGGPRWRTSIAIATCSIVALAFLSQRVL